MTPTNMNKGYNKPLPEPNVLEDLIYSDDDFDAFIKSYPRCSLPHDFCIFVV